MNTLTKTIETAKNENISTIVVASTTGQTALRLFELAKGEKLKLIVVTHDEGKMPNDRKFNEDIRRTLLANHVTVYTHNPAAIIFRKIMNALLEKVGLPTWHKHLREVKDKYGPGMKVCYIITQMLIEGGALRDVRILAIAGKKSGADSSAIFLIKPRCARPILERIIISPEMA